MQKTAKIILGIDPGTIVMGYGLITVKNNTITLLELGVLKPGKAEDSYKKLQLIFNTVSGLITKYQPTDFAIEAPFFGKNVQSMLKLGRAQGVAIAAAMRHGLTVTEYSPKKVKQSVTGNGNADNIYGSDISAEINFAEISNKTVEVLEENRSLKAINGIFSDIFKPYELHIYKVSNK